MRIAPSFLIAGLILGSAQNVMAQEIHKIPFSVTDENYDISSVISQTQADNIIHSILTAAPAGTKVSDISLAGTYDINAQHYLTTVNMTHIDFKAVVYSFLKDSISIQLSANMTDGDCAHPVITAENESGSNQVIDDKLKAYLKDHAIEVVKDHLIHQTDLEKYCRVKPTKNYVVRFYPNP